MNINAQSRAVAMRTGGASSRTPKPVIEGLTQNLEVDLAALGNGDLKATIQGAGLQPGDKVYSNWRGLNSAGEPFDCIGELTLVSDPNNVVVTINNDVVVDAKDGYAFLSYQVNSVTAEESLRQFCYVGLRAPSRLPVVQILQSHDLNIDKDELQQYANVVTPACQAIQQVAEAKLTIRRFRNSGSELSKLEKQLPRDQKFDGEPLEWLISKAELNTVDVGGWIEISYTITLKDGGELAPSRVQKFVISGPTDPGTLLPAPQVGDGSDPIDPGSYPDGVQVHIKGYPNAAVGDYLLLAWVMPSGEAHVQVTRLDESSLVAGQFTLRIEQAVLSASIGAVQVYYQYGREGASLTSQVQSLVVRAPRVVPPMPTVRGSKQLEGNEYDIYAFDIRRNGADIIIPAEADLLPNEDFEVHWQGEPNGGRTVIYHPTAEGPRVFNVPPEFVGANMGNEASKRFDVFYRIVDRETLQHWDSKPVKLLVLPLEKANYPMIDSPDADWQGNLELKPEGARLTLNPWAFIKKDQLLSIHVSGIGLEPADEFVRKDVPVKEAEVTEGVVDMLSYDLLKKLEPNKEFKVWASVKFDGVTPWEFPWRGLTVKA